MAFAPYYAVSRANSRARKTTSAVRYKVKPKTGAKMKRKIPVGMMVDAAVSGYRYLRTRRMKKKRLSTKIAPSGAGSTTSYYTSGKKTMPKVMYDMFKTNRVYNTADLASFRLDNNLYGRQFVGVRQFYNAINFEQDLNRAVGIQTTDQRQTSSLYYSDFNMVSTFTNMEMTTSYLDIYEIEPRFHLPLAVDPLTWWESGLISEGVSSGAASQVYEKPFTSRLFCLYFKVLKIISIELSPGQSHKHTATYHVNKRVDGAILRTYNALRDVTKYQMYVASGTPINDATQNTLVSTSTVAIDVVTRTSYKYIKDVVVRDSYVTTNSLGAITTANIINDVSIKPDSEA